MTIGISNYFVSVCSDNQEICGSHFISKRKLKYLKPEYKNKQICECNEDGKSVEYKSKLMIMYAKLFNHFLFYCKL